MDFQSAMETFAEAWMAANTKSRPVEISDNQRDGSPANGRTEEDMTSREPTNRLTNGSSPVRDSPVSLVRESDHGSPRPANNNELRFGDNNKTYCCLLDTGSSVNILTQSVADELLKQGLAVHHRYVNTRISGTGENQLKVGEGKAPLALHVVIECVPICSSRMGVDLDLQGRVEVDSYTLVPPNLRFSDILQVVLAKTGFLDDLPYARGFLRLKNWRPLPVEQVPESDSKTISEVLSDLANLATLYIRLYSSARLRCTRDIKDRLLRLLVTQSQHLLISAGCPLDENLLFSLIRGNGEISEESARQFEAWWAVQVAHASRPPPTSGHILSSHPAHGHLPNPSHVMDKVSSDPIHPALQTMSPHYGLHKTRMRTSFDPEFELPRLHRWFSDNQHPTRLQIQQYVAELNALESRKGRKPLDVNNVVYWFKNARAAYKRQEFRSLNGMKSPTPDEVSVSDIEDSTDYNPLPHPLDNHRSPPHHQPQIGQQPPPQSLTHPQSQHTQLESPSTKANLSHAQTTPTDESSVYVKQEEDSKTSSTVTASDQNRNLAPLTSGGSILDGGSASGGDRDPLESDIDMSEDDDDCRSAESNANHDIKAWGSPSPVVSPGALSLPPYPSIPGLGQPGGVDRLPYSVMSGPLFQHSMMYMAQYMPQVPPFPSGLSSSGLPEERRKRNRTFIDPVSEVPRLEQWFAINTHPSHNLILKYTEELNRMPYRQKFPKLEPKNIQFWFKNRRAKCKRLRVSM